MPELNLLRPWGCKQLAGIPGLGDADLGAAPTCITNGSGQAHGSSRENGQLHDHQYTTECLMFEGQPLESGCFDRGQKGKQTMLGSSCALSQLPLLEALKSTEKMTDLERLL